MAKKLNSVLGIDIGSQRIKVCEMKTQGREPVVTALGIIDTPEGAVDHTGVYNSDAVGSALKQVLSESGATSSNAVVTIAGQASVLVRTLEVPRMNAAELKEHMLWEINRNIPFAESDVMSDFKPLGGDDPNSPNMDVVMAIAPNSAVDTIMACLKRAGRTTAAIDVEPLSIARSIQTSYADLLADKTICMVEMGFKTTSINIYRGSKLLMPRQVPLGGEMFTKAIADALATSVSDAETIKVERGEIPESAISGAGQQAGGFGGGFGNDYQNYNPFGDDYAAPTYAPDPTISTNPFAEQDVAPYSPAPDPVAPNPYDAPASYSHITDPYGFEEPAAPGAELEPPIAEAHDAPSFDPYSPPVDTTPAVVEDQEMLRVYHAFAPVLDELISEVRRSIDYYRSRGGEVDVIELSGGGTRLKGLAEYITNAIGIPCDAYDPLRNLNMNAKKVPPAFVEEHRQEFAVAVGNGLHIFFD
jgi:type IV pilus assembly protein PilM